MARKNTFFGGAAILAAGIAMVKLIGAVFKIPIVNILDTGYADFSNAYNIYALFLTISTAGLPVALSKMVAAADALGRERQVRKIFRVSLAVFFGLGFCSFLLMFLGSGFLAGLLHDTKAAKAIRYLAPAVVCVSCLSSFRGYAQGHANMAPSAISQVIEALGKLVIGLPLAYLAVKAGMGDETSAAFAILGVTIGSALALLYMLLHYARTRPALTGPRAVDSSDHILGQLLAIAVPITLTSSAVSIITLIDSSLVQGQLQTALAMTEDQSRKLYAAYAGVMTIYNLPSAFIIAVTASVIPAVSAALAQRRAKAAARVVRAAIHITALLVFPMGVGMSVLAKPIVQMLFSRLDADLSGSLLSVLGVAAIFVCLVSVANSILQAYGYQYIPIFTTVLAGIVKIVVNYNLVAIPSVNIHGAPVGTLCCFALSAAIDLWAIRRVAPRAPKYFRLFFGPALASAVMGVAAWGSYKLLHLFLGNTPSVLGAVVVAVGVYGFLVVLLQLLSRDELRLMPKGDKIADLLRLP